MRKKGVATSLGFVGKLLAAGVARVPPARALRWHVSSVCTCPQRTHTDHKLRPWRRWFTLQHVVVSFSTPARVSSAHTDSLSPRTQARHVLTAPVVFSLSLTLGVASTLSLLGPSATRALPRRVRSGPHLCTLSPSSGLQPYERFPSTSDPQHVRSHVHLALFFLLSRPVPGPAFSRTPRSALSWRVASVSPPIGGGHASFPRHRDRWVFTPGEIAAGCSLLHPTTVKRSSSSFSSFGGNSRRSRTTALFARESLAGNLTASPSIPRGMSPHGARWLWAPFDGVCSCGGGGVVASLMDVVWRERGV